MIDGLSESAWKSLVVKALRAGWPNGLIAAAQRLSPATMRDLLFVGLYEDVWPTREELPEAVAEIKRQDYIALCRRETLHGRGYAERFCDMADQAVQAAGSMKRGIVGQQVTRLRMLSKQVGTPLWSRGLNCLFTWDFVKPSDTGVTRLVDMTPFVGMPDVVADGHTYEGKRRGTDMMILSGHYEQHREIGRLVMATGWDPIRRQMHETLLPGVPMPLPRAEQAMSLFQD